MLINYGVDKKKSDNDEAHFGRFVNLGRFDLGFYCNFTVKQTNFTD